MESVISFDAKLESIDLNSLKPLKEIERSIIKSYRKYIWVKFIKAIKEYEMLNKGDKVCVAISGGKDSLLLAKLFQELHKHSVFEFDLEFIAMDPGYATDVRKRLEENLAYLKIPATIYDSDVFSVAERISGDNPCYMCARMRRGSLYSKAKEKGCNVLALGHHFDDVIETTMLNILYAGNFKTMRPKLKAQNFDNMVLIRPMYLIDEESIIKWTKKAGLEPLDCACTVAAKKTGSKRFEIKELIKDLSPQIVNLRENIFRSTSNIDLGSCLAWKDKDGNKHSFLDDF